MRVHAAETEITRILGEPLALPRPPLPSDRRGKRKPAPAAVSSDAPRAATPSAATSAVEAPGPRASGEKLRRLEEGEHAYRVSYRQFGRATVELHYEFSALATLVASQGAQLQVERIETLDASGAVRAVLA